MAGIIWLQMEGIETQTPGAAARTRPTYANTDVSVIVLAILRAMRVTFVNLFRKPVTVHYPDKTRAYPDRYRGLLALVYEKDTGEEACIGCRLCEYVCPPAVIQVEMLKTPKRNYAKTFTLELYACEFCELCVQVCPTDAIVMMKSFDLATSDRRELLLDKDRLHAIGLQHEVSWATGTRLRDMQGPPKQARAVAAAEASAAAGPSAAATASASAKASASATALADKPGDKSAETSAPKDAPAEKMDGVA